MSIVATRLRRIGDVPAPATQPPGNSATPTRARTRHTTPPVIVRIFFVVFVLLALLGDARIFLFVMNRVVFGEHREEKSPWHFLLFVTPPVLLFLTALFLPVNRWLDRIMSMRFVEYVAPERLEEVAWSLLAAKVGAAWLIIAATVGAFWILERIRINVFGEVPLAGVRTLAPEVIRLRKARLPFAWVQRLGGHNDLYDIEVTRHEVEIDDLPRTFDGYRVAFLTDTHVASFMRRGFYRECVAQVLRFDPDLILLGGDFVTWEKHIELMAEVLLTDLQARDGVFAVLGNHDYWANGAKVRAAMEARGVQFLINDSVPLRRDGATIDLAGVDEVYRGTPDVVRAFANVDPTRPCLGVSHHPDIIDRLSGRRLDLLVCGHTHGGQIRLPFFGAIVVPSRHEDEYAAGFHRDGGVLMYVSRGIGAVPPLRILCRPEVATFTLRRGQRFAS